MLMRSFHQMRVELRFIYKSFNCIGIKEWFQLQKQWKCVITTDACAYTKNVSMHWYNSNLRKLKINYFLKFLEKQKLTLTSQFEKWYEIEIWTSNTLVK